MTDFDYGQLDPGIRDTVRLLREADFETTDSGDGRTKPVEERTMPGRHVVAVLSACEPTKLSADRMAALLGPGWFVQATYSPDDGQVVLVAMHREAEREMFGPRD